MSLNIAAAIDTRRQDEERRRAALPRIEGGQMADSYDTLHGVRFITLILDTIPAALSDAASLQYALYLHDLFLLETLTELTQRAERALSAGAPGEAVDHLTWVGRLLQYKHGGDSLICTPHGAMSDEPATAALLAALDELSASLLQHLKSRTASSVLGRPDDPDTRLLHLAKTMILQVKETVLTRRTPPPEIDPAILAAHGRCVAAASRGLDLDGDTYLNQFCLLHQLPELLTPLVLRRFDLIEAALDTDDRSSALEAARTAGDILHLVIASLWPLIELLYPSQYYAFRENLGATSGSSSAAIRGKLLTAAYARLGKAVLAWTERNADYAGSGPLMGEIVRIRGLIYRWRGLHMALPRNVLGSNGTKSLMGSPDAMKAVEAMAESFQAKDPMTRLLGPLPDRDFSPESATAELDRWLLAATGEAAQQRFRQVQERTGAWRRVKAN